MLAWQNLSPCIVHCNFVVTQGCVTQKLFPTEFTSVSLDTRVDFQMYIKTAFLCVAFATDVTRMLLHLMGGKFVPSDLDPFHEGFPTDVAFLGLENFMKARHVCRQPPLGLTQSAADLTAELGSQLLWTQAA